MDHIERITKAILARVPEANIEIERSENMRGPVWIDVRHDGQAVSVEWRQGLPLGLTSLPTESYGDAVDELHDTIEDLASRIEFLFTNQQRTQGPHEAALAKLRAHQRISQDDLANLLGVSQPNVSKTEKQVDMSVQKLKSIIEALGGKLEIVAKFGDQTIRVSQFDETSQS